MKKLYLGSVLLFGLFFTPTMFASSQNIDEEMETDNKKIIVETFYEENKDDLSDDDRRGNKEKALKREKASKRADKHLNLRQLDKKNKKKWK
jgi:hypothetical protein